MSAITIARRYIVKDEIGQGGMGTVYRVDDRITGREIALKRVTDTDTLEFQDRPTSATEVRLALANEFKVLASLRHPNIIAVIDYGFDEQNLPFFTMPYVDDADDILTAGLNATFDEKLKLWMQMLQASVYLHRRNVLHRDLKPANVLVKDGQVKVMDFGLSIRAVDTSQDFTPDDTIAGTLSYLAPEVLQGGAPTRSADLYAIGLIVYQMFTGKYPFDQTNITNLITEILTKEPDCSGLDIDSRLTDILRKMLTKSSDDRYQRAVDVIQDLTDALDMPPAPETAAIRDSFLKAAELVGREQELNHLSMALQRSTDGQGSVWMVGGESGVGKSRLVDEIRTRALVDGVLVMRGQSVNTGKRVYQVWHDILRELAIYTDVTEAEANILYEVDPSLVDIDQPATISQHDPQEVQRLLFETVANMLKRLHQPLMIILEDLQWEGEESFSLLRYLNNSIVPVYPIFVLGNYRDDERPDLPDMLRDVNFLKVERLSHSDIASLSASMLGEDVGRRRAIVDLLERETEGNVFFIVEVVRALAENAGQLDLIGQMTLPQNVFADGVRTVIQRRLEKVPAEQLPLLKLVAVAGRYIDYDLVKRLADDFGTDIDMWLNAGADVAILEVVDGRWQFAHDKLRERLLEDLTDDERPQLYRKVAETIEALYPNDPTTYQQLAHLWLVADDIFKETFYASESGQIELQTNANDSAAGYFRRAMKCLLHVPDYPDKLRRQLVLQIQLSVALTASLGYSADAVEESYLKAHQLSLEVGETPFIFRALYGMTSAYSARGLLNKAEQYALNLLQMADYMPLEFQLMAHNIKASINLRQGKASNGIEHFEFVHDHYDKVVHSPLGIQYGQDPGLSAFSFGTLTWMQIGQVDRAEQWRQEALCLADELGYPFARIFADYYAGTIGQQIKREWQGMLDHAETALKLARQYNYPFFESMAIMSIAKSQGMQATSLEAIQENIQLYYEGLDLWASLGAPRDNPNWLGVVSELHIEAGEYTTALDLLDKAITLSEARGEAFTMAEYYRLCGLALWRMGASVDEVEAEFRTAIETAQNQNMLLLEFRSAITLAEFWLTQGKHQQIQDLLTPLLAPFEKYPDLVDTQNAHRVLDDIK